MIQERWELIENEMMTFQDDLKAFNEKGGSEDVYLLDDIFI